MRFLLVALLLPLLHWSCADTPQGIATLVDFTGSVEIQREVDATWSAAENGKELSKRSSLRTAAASTAKLRFADGSTLDIDERSLLHFSPSKHDDAVYKINMEIGTARFRSRETEHVLDVDNVITKVAASSQFQIHKEQGRKTRLTLLVGEVTLRSPGGALTLEVGSIVELPQESTEHIVVLADAGIPLLDAPAEVAASSEPPSPTQDAVAGPITASVKKRMASVRVPGHEWSALPKGQHTLAPHSEFKVAKRGIVQIQRGLQRVEVHGPASFAIGDKEPDTDLMSFYTGSATVTTTDSDARIVVPGGAFTVKASPGQGSKATIRAGQAGSSLTARAGLSLAIGNAGQRRVLSIGEVAILNDTGDLRIEHQSPLQHDLLLRFGESPVVRDPSPPTAIRFDVSEHCPAEAIVEVSTRAKPGPDDRLASGQGGANIELPSGEYWYRARCLEAGVAASYIRKPRRLTIVKDSANRVLPSRVPHNVIEADGRRYDLRYQRTLPKLSFQWPRAPNGASYSLRIRDAQGQERNFPSKTPSVDLRSGEVGEGTYEFFFEGGGKSSRPTRLMASFDSSAQSAELQSPAPNATWPAEVKIRGIAAKRWAVALRHENGTTPIHSDQHGRFALIRAADTLGLSFAIELSNPHSRPQLYLRRNDLR